MRPSPTFIDRLQARIRELDQAATSAIACASAHPLTGPASIIPSHLHSLRARLAALHSDLACLVAMARAADMPAPVLPSGQGRDGSEALSLVVGAGVAP